MSDDTITVDDDDNISIEPAERTSQERNWRELRSQKDEYEKRALMAERELAFTKAGISTDDPKAKYFVKGYEGEIDPDAIRQAAIDAGFLDDPDSAPSAEEAALGRMAEATNGADPAGQVPLEEALRNAKDEADVMRIVSESGLPFAGNRPHD